MPFHHSTRAFVFVPLASLLFLLASGGCTTTNGPGPGGKDGGSSSTSNTSGDGTEGFVGTWTIVSGSSKVSCPNASPTVTSETGTLIVTASNGGSLTAVSPSCTFTAEANGDVASEAPSSQTCVLTDSKTGGDIFLTYTAYTFTLSSSDTAATLSAQGTVEEFVGSNTIDCTFVEGVEYVKD